MSEAPRPRESFPYLSDMWKSESQRIGRVGGEYAAADAATQAGKARGIYFEMSRIVWLCEGIFFPLCKAEGCYFLREVLITQGGREAGEEGRNRTDEK